MLMSNGGNNNIFRFFENLSGALSLQRTVRGYVWASSLCLPGTGQAAARCFPYDDCRGITCVLRQPCFPGLPPGRSRGRRKGTRPPCNPSAILPEKTSARGLFEPRHSLLQSWQSYLPIQISKEAIFIHNAIKNQIRKPAQRALTGMFGNELITPGYRRIKSTASKTSL